MSQKLSHSFLTKPLVLFANMLAFALSANAADIRLLPENPVTGMDYSLLDLGNNPAWSKSEMGPDYGQPVKRDNSGPDTSEFFSSAGGIYIGEGGGSYRKTFLRTTWDTMPGSRVIEISGQIEDGDTEQLKALVEATGFSKCISPGRCPHNNTIAFNSPGGNLVEALKLGEYIADQNFATLLDKGAICESACALAFLAGYTKYEGYFFPRRYAHETATLGIHRPFFTLPERTYSSDEVGNVVAIVNEAIIRATSYLLTVGIDLGFLQRMYATPGNDMYRLSGLEMSAQQIFVLGAERKVTSLNRREIFAYCSTIYQSEYSVSNDELLANLQTNGSAFITFVAGQNFICAGATKASTGQWRSHICIDDTVRCGLADFAQNEMSYHRVTDETAWNIATAIDVLPVGAALRDYRHRSALLRYIRLFAEKGAWYEFNDIPYAAAQASVPDAYCDDIDGFDPALVLAVQARLNQNGINVGKPDGAAGPNTRKGIQKFNQTSLGRDSEKIDIALLTALGMTAADAAPYKLCP
ncbi:MAG: hypothetical protein ABJX32_00810 [Tateyamaria sp.]